MANPPIHGDSNSDTVPAVLGTNTNPARNSVGVEGSSDNGFGVFGHSKTGRGVVARSVSDYALRAHSDSSSAIRADSTSGVGIEGTSKGAAQGIVGTSADGDGVLGKALQNGAGVVGTSQSGFGVHGHTSSGIGVYGESETYEGVRGVSKNINHGGIVGINTAGGTGVFGASNHQLGVGVYGKGERLAAYFDGDVEVTGDIRLINKADFAEDFEVAERVEPGTVMVLGDNGELHESDKAYDKRVAGVISGAGHYKPGIILDAQDSASNRLPIGLMGKVYCKVEAHSSPIEIGDLLTSSATPGHAMKATDTLKAYGCVIGKALQPLDHGQGLIAILVTLQ